MTTAISLLGNRLIHKAIIMRCHVGKWYEIVNGNIYLYDS
jgi:hypothetical protein